MARKLLPSDEVWLRQPEETEKAYAAFECYLEMSDGRSITEVAKRLSKSRQLIDGWRSKFNWKERAQAYDNFIVSGKAKKVRREIEARYERLGRISDQLLALGMTKAKAADPNKLSHREAIDYMAIALKMAEASRSALTLTEVEERRLDLAFLKLEMSQPPPATEDGGSNLIEALTTTLNENVADFFPEYPKTDIIKALNVKALEVWGEVEKPDGKEDNADE